MPTKESYAGGNGFFARANFTAADEIYTRALDQGESSCQIVQHVALKLEITPRQPMMHKIASRFINRQESMGRGLSVSRLLYLQHAQHGSIDEDALRKQANRLLQSLVEQGSSALPCKACRFGTCLLGRSCMEVWATLAMYTPRSYRPTNSTETT